MFYYQMNRQITQILLLGALTEYQGAVILVSHDAGAVEALKPERVLLLPDGDEDLWKDEYFDLVTID